MSASTIFRFFTVKKYHAAFTEKRLPDAYPNKIPNWMLYAIKEFFKWVLPNMDFICSWKLRNPEIVGAFWGTSFRSFWIVSSLLIAVSSTSSLICWWPVHWGQYKYWTKKKKTNPPYRIIPTGAPCVECIQRPEDGHGLVVATLGHQELGTLRKEHAAGSTEQTGQTANGQKDLPRVDCWKNKKEHFEKKNESRLELIYSSTPSLCGSLKLIPCWNKTLIKRFSSYFFSRKILKLHPIKWPLLQFHIPFFFVLLKLSWCIAAFFFVRDLFPTQPGPFPQKGGPTEMHQNVSIKWAATSPLGHATFILFYIYFLFFWES